MNQTFFICLLKSFFKRNKKDAKHSQKVKNLFSRRRNLDRGPTIPRSPRIFFGVETRVRPIPFASSREQLGQHVAANLSSFLFRRCRSFVSCYFWCSEKRFFFFFFIYVVSFTVIHSDHRNFVLTVQEFSLYTKSFSNPLINYAMKFQLIQTNEHLQILIMNRL